MSVLTLTQTLRSRSLSRTFAFAAVAGLATGLAGCRVHVNKDASGQEKNVQIDTPFGGMHVDTNQTTAADLGLPAYPNAQIYRDSDNDKSANVHMGFGEWEMRVQVVNYTTPDSQDKVVAFYKKALGRFGNVIECQDKHPVGAPAQTSEGLSCSDDGNAHASVNSNGSTNYGYSNQDAFQLKAGSKRHQHIVAFESSAPGQTRFNLVEIQLPAGLSGSSSKSD
ncbi:MAG: hypothetical protein ACLGP3_12170 [Acidobacteriota bacterium]